MPYASTSQQRMFNARAAAGDPKFIKLARDYNKASFGRPGWTKKGKRISKAHRATAAARTR